MGKTSTTNYRREAIVASLEAVAGVSPGKVPSTSTDALMARVQAAVKALEPKTYTVATVPDATVNVGRVIYVSNGAAGSPCAAISNGTDWLRVTLGVAIAGA